MLTLSFALLGTLAFAFAPAITYAESTEGNEQGQTAEAEAGSTDGICEGAGERCTHFIETYINPFIYLLSGLVGVVAVISIIMAGIQYSSSADDPGTVSKAKKRIFNTVIGLVAYIFLFAFLEYLVPGGLY